MSSSLLRRIASWVPGWVKKRVSARIKYFLYDRLKYVPRTVVIDIVGSCNLGCPSCPSGDGRGLQNRGGKMSLEMFERIIEKISREQPGTTVALFNWTESLIHPQVEEFIVAIRRRGLKSRISTNLNILRDPDKLAAARLDSMTISLSGFTQPVYVIGHKDGDIEIVKQNMRRLSEAFRRAGALTEVTVYYHKYLYNLHEIELMREYAESLGFRFGASWAYYMPVERVQEYVEGKLPQPEVEFIEKYFALNIRSAVEATKPFRSEPCHLPVTLLTLDCRGDVQLCCSVYDAGRFTIGSYLETPFEIIEQRLKSHSYCRECTKHGLHIYTAWHGHRISGRYEQIAADECLKKPTVGLMQNVVQPMNRNAR